MFNNQEEEDEERPRQLPSSQGAPGSQGAPRFLRSLAAASQGFLFKRLLKSHMLSKRLTTELRSQP